MEEVRGPTPCRLPGRCEGTGEVVDSQPTSEEVIEEKVEEETLLLKSQKNSNWHGFGYGECPCVIAMQRMVIHYI